MRQPALHSLFGASVRCELWFTAPFSLLGGGLYGFQLAEGAGALRWLVVVGGALALTVFVAIQIALEPVVVERMGGREGRYGLVAAYLWDALTGTVVGIPVVAALGTPTLPGIGAAVSAGAVYGFIMGNVVCGDASAVVARALLSGGGIRRGPDHSHAQALESQGRFEAALAAYQEATARHPRDPLPYLARARLMERLGRPLDALECLRQARIRATLSKEQTVLVLQRMAGLHAESGHPERMAPELARYLEEEPEGPGAAWARREILEIKAALARELELPSDP